MKHFALLVALVALSAVAEDKIPLITAAQAKDYVGTVATVCGRVVDSHIMDPGVTGFGRPVAFSLTKAGLFTMVTFGPALKDDNSLENRDKTSQQVIREFMGKDVCVTGKIAKRGNDEAPFIFERDRTRIKVKPASNRTANQQ